MRSRPQTRPDPPASQSTDPRLAAVDQVVKLLRTPMSSCLQGAKREAFDGALAEALERLAAVWGSRPLADNLKVMESVQERSQHRAPDWWTVNGDPWLTSAEIEELYKIDVSTLCQWRAKLLGPPFRQLGRAIHYRKSDIEAFIEASVKQPAKNRA